MPSKEAAVWRVFYRYYPFDDMHVHHRGPANVTAAIINVNRDPKVRREPFSWTDFVPFRFDEDDVLEVLDEKAPKTAPDIAEKMRMARDLFKP